MKLVYLFDEPLLAIVYRGDLRQGQSADVVVALIGPR